MKPKSYMGCAGTGKTTRLLEDVGRHLSENLLVGEQRLLAITRMNGARRRLGSKLRARSLKAVPYECRTIDSLAWMIAARWRGRASQLQLPSPNEMDFDGTCGLAARLLQEPDVSRWLAATYPVVMVDECQDCHGERLALVQRLAGAIQLFVAADDFQNLEALESPAVSWIREATDLVELDTVHRTTQPALLAAASLARSLKSLPQGWNTSQGFSLVGAKSAPMAAKLLVQQIHWTSGKELVVLSPTGPGASAFVDEVLARAAANPAFVDKRGKALKPCNVSWELGAEQAVNALMAAVENGTYRSSRLTGATELLSWFDRQRRVRGSVTHTQDQIRVAAQRAVQHHRAHSRGSGSLRGMTIHQAKNQEFDRVVVLWPIQVAGKGESLSRLLYNAITRAKTSAVVIVQDINNRMKKPPFTI